MPIAEARECGHQEWVQVTSPVRLVVEGEESVAVRFGVIAWRTWDPGPSCCLTLSLASS
jgi:hypothetical protein